MNFNLYKQNINQFVDIIKISDSPTAFMCVTFFAEWFELAGEQEVSCNEIISFMLCFYVLLIIVCLMLFYY